MTVLGVTSAIDARMRTTGIQVGANGSALNLGYSYKNGHLNTHTVGALTFSYDAVNRLTSSKESGGTGGEWSKYFGYDQFGNRSLRGRRLIDLGRD